MATISGDLANAPAGPPGEDPVDIEDPPPTSGPSRVAGMIGVWDVSTVWRLVGCLVSTSGLAPAVPASDLEVLMAWSPPPLPPLPTLDVVLSLAFFALYEMMLFMCNGLKQCSCA